jgi:hypothetical protein
MNGLGPPKFLILHEAVLLETNLEVIDGQDSCLEFLLRICPIWAAVLSGGFGFPRCVQVQA